MPRNVMRREAFGGSKCLFASIVDIVLVDVVVSGECSFRLEDLLTMTAKAVARGALMSLATLQFFPAGDRDRDQIPAR